MVTDVPIEQIGIWHHKTIRRKVKKQNQMYRVVLISSQWKNQYGKRILVLKKQVPGPEVGI